MDTHLTKSQKLLYSIIKELGGIDDKTKLAKLEYFSDFIHYAFHNEPISDPESLYEKRPFGPLARNFNTDLTTLVTLGFLNQKGKYAYQIKSETDTELTPDEKKTIKYVVSKYGNYTYDILSDISHKQIPYLSSTEGGIVEYDTAYNLVDEYPDYVA